MADDDFSYLKKLAQQEDKAPTEDQFTFYVFQGHSQRVLTDNQKEVAFIGFIRNHFQLIFDQIPEVVLTLCLRFYVCEEKETNVEDSDRMDGMSLNDTQKLQLAERLNGIYRQQLKYMQDHLASLRSLIQDKENIIVCDNVQTISIFCFLFWYLSKYYSQIT